MGRHCGVADVRAVDGHPLFRGSHLRSGNTASCGCYHKKRVSETSKTHGLTGKTGNSHYTRWMNIKARTANPNNSNYQNYGERGIKMYPAWFNNFILFKTWLDENLGPCPDGYSLDRIDNDGHYCPSNLRWASAKTQNNNQRTRKNQ